MVEVVQLLKGTESVPINVNGDLYTHADIREMKRRSGCDGIMLARPALYNMSLFHKEDKLPSDQSAQDKEEDMNMPLSQFQTTNHSGRYGYNSPLLQSRTSIIREYISHCVRYRTHSKNAKYVVCEMMNARRAPTNRVPFLNMALEDGQTVNAVCQCRSLNDLVKIWDVRDTIPLPKVASDEQRCMSRDSGGMGDLHNYSDDYFLNPQKFHSERAAAAAATAFQETKATTPGEITEEKKIEIETDGSAPAAKRPKL